MTMPCALSHLPLAAHHRASTGGATPAGGLAFDVVRLNSARVMVARSTAHSLDMALLSIGQKQAVACHEGIAIFARRRRDDPVYRIAWGLSWKEGRGDQ